MINYIKNEEIGGMDYPMMSLKSRSALGLIKKLCEVNLFSLEGYLKSIKKHMNLGYKIPIFINDHMIFIYTHSLKDYENIFINYLEVNEVVEQGKAIVIHFKNKDTIQVNFSLNQYKRLVRTIFNIFKYKESLV